MGRRIVAALLVLSLFAGVASAANSSTRNGGALAGGSLGAVFAWGSGIVIPVIGVAVPGLVVGAAIGSAFGYLLSNRN